MELSTVYNAFPLNALIPESLPFRRITFADPLRSADSEALCCALICPLGPTSFFLVSRLLQPTLSKKLSLLLSLSYTSSVLYHPRFILPPPPPPRRRRRRCSKRVTKSSPSEEVTLRLAASFRRFAARTTRRASRCGTRGPTR